MFVDHIRIVAQSGKGGNGSVSFRREKFIPRGGPDGGDGGKGGDIILEVDHHTDNLKSFFFNPKLRAKDGVNGSGARKSGKSGPDLVVKVPPGTLVYRDLAAEGTSHSLEGAEVLLAPDGSEFLVDDLETSTEGEEAASLKRSLKQRIDDGSDLELVADLTEIGQRFILAKGGKGGKGNVHFKSATNRVPFEFTAGEACEAGTFYLELRQIADAGLVGFPNAGKSTILTRLSAAKPKVAAYPFTTLHPMVGVVEYPKYQRLTVADIPGLIEGAHENVGLGFEFLRHILRCRLLVMVVDVAGSEGRDPCEDLSTLRTEIKMYDKLLAKRPWIIVANKMDLPEADERLAQLKQRFPKVKILPISAQDNTGLDALRAELKKRVLG